MPAIVVIQNDETATIIQADPALCSFSAVAPLGDPYIATDGTLAVNTNYSMPGNVYVGLMMSQGQRVRPSVPLPSNKPRTALVLKPHAAPSLTPPITAPDDAWLIADATANGWTVIQAGPRLLEQGVMLSGIKEHCPPAMLRQGQQVAIGITAAGMLLFGYVQDETAASLASRLRAAGAIDVMKCDGGGGVAHLSFGGIHRGTSQPQTMLLATPLA